MDHPPGPLGEPPRTEHPPGPLGEPPPQEHPSPPASVEPHPAGPAAPHGDPLTAPAGLSSGDPLGPPKGPSSGDPLGAPSPPPDTHGSGWELPPEPSGPDVTRWDPAPAPPAQDPGAAPPPPAAAGSVPASAVPPPYSAPPAPTGEPGTQAYPPAPTAYAGAQAPAYGQPAGPPEPTTGAETSPYALKRPVGRQILLAFLSFGLWTYYWFYDTRKKLNAELGKPDDAGVKTACLLIPIYNIILIYQLWDDLNTLRTRSYRLPDLNVTVLLVVAILVPFGVLYSYPKIANALNEYWDYRTQGQATEAPVTRIEKILAAVGLVFVGFWLLLVILLVALA